MTDVIVSDPGPELTALNVYLDLVETSQMFVCDSCRTARADVEWTHRPSLLPLRFCCHHSRIYSPRLLGQDFVVTKPSLSASR